MIAAPARALAMSGTRVPCRKAIFIELPVSVFPAPLTISDGYTGASLMGDDHTDRRAVDGHEGLTAIAVDANHRAELM